jgi:hypothetical protein
VILAEDPEAFRAHWLELPEAAGSGCAASSVTVIRPTGWPALNNSAPSSRSYADRVLLADSAGVVDHVTLGASDGKVPVGRSLERMAPVSVVATEPARWAACTALAGGTPGCPNSVATTVGGDALQATPNPFAPRGPAAASLHVRFRLGAGEGGYDLRIYDLWGQLVRDLGGDGLGPGPRHAVWDGRDDSGRPVPPGGYIVLLRRHDPGGRVLRGERTLVALIGEP